ncbi:hypothetical protein EV215_1469 [Hypnocyclicus thermotrophus]|uniref:Cof subfamily protein (Haloacid dehalogenase superfamily)/HAD superfamily hydrolase (TIGR01484 family) n=1 Tax=Hypnocyclicus thermotrophus TaxID=1627895 RepID=A0AA46DY02_9FUSO|nr:Cof-type HAD-IIB family hydrolase [Hypnocyclicus thermotrophus]TDT69127.1 hypothetical protein EV215_1469 [Hypnocyclicus thermotrophus]
MKNIKLIVCDLDGTLLNSNHEISDFNIEILKKLKKNGLEIILASGRSYEAMLPTINKLNLTNEIISYNGAAIYKNNNLIFQKVLSKNISKELINIGKTKNIYFHAFHNFKWYIEEFTNEAKEYKERSGLQEHYIDFSTLENPNFLKLMYISSKENIDILEKFLKEKYKNTIYLGRSNDNFLEVMHKNVSKANALKQILKNKNFNTENIMAFGDGFNDYEMLKYAKIGVVMDNANKKLKSLIKYKTISNDENGVGIFLKKFFNL